MVVNASITEPCCPPRQVATTWNECYEKQTVLATKSEQGMSNLVEGRGSGNGVLHFSLGVEIKWDNTVSYGAILCNFINSVSVGVSLSGEKNPLHLSSTDTSSVASQE